MFLFISTPKNGTKIYSCHTKLSCLSASNKLSANLLHAHGKVEWTEGHNQSTSLGRIFNLYMLKEHKKLGGLPFTIVKYSFYFQILLRRILLTVQAEVAKTPKQSSCASMELCKQTCYAC